MDDISSFLKELNTNCSKVVKHNFRKNETITTYIEKRDLLCILLQGEADLIRYDFNGNKTIIGHFVENNIFGETLYPANTNNELFVQANLIVKYYFSIIMISGQNVNQIVHFIKIFQNKLISLY